MMVKALGALSALLVLHRGLGSDEETASEAESYDKVLFYHPGDHPMSRQLELSRYTMAMIDFNARFDDDDGAATSDDVQVVHLQHRVFCLRRWEKDVWIVCVMQESSVDRAGVVASRGGGGVNTEAVMSLLRTMMHAFTLLHGTVARNLNGQTGGADILKRVAATRKALRKVDLERLRCEPAYGQDADNKELSADGDTPQHEAASPNAALSELLRLHARTSEDLKALLKRSPAPPLKRRLHDFLSVYVDGTDFQNLHLFEAYQPFHSGPSDPRVLRVAHLLPRRLSGPPSLGGLSILYDGHLVWQGGGLSRYELLLVYSYLRARDLAHIAATTSASANAPSASSGSRLAALVEQQTKKQTLMGKLSTAFQRLNAKADPTLDTMDGGERTTPVQGFLAAEGWGLTMNATDVWMPQLTPMGPDGPLGAMPESRYLLVYVSHKFSVIVVMDESFGAETHTHSTVRIRANELRSQHQQHCPPHMLDKEALETLATELDAHLSVELLPLVSHRIPPTHAHVEGTRYTHFNHTSHAFATSHPHQPLPQAQAWPPLSLSVVRHRHSVVTPALVTVLDEVHSTLREGDGWGAHDQQHTTNDPQDTFQEVGMRTAHDGWVVARRSCGREVVATFDSRAASILDAQSSMNKLVCTAFKNVHVP